MELEVVFVGLIFGLFFFSFFAAGGHATVLVFRGLLQSADIVFAGMVLGVKTVAWVGEDKGMRGS